MDAKTKKLGRVKISPWDLIGIDHINCVIQNSIPRGGHKMQNDERNGEKGFFKRNAIFIGEMPKEKKLDFWKDEFLVQKGIWFLKMKYQRKWRIWFFGLLKGRRKLECFKEWI